MSPRYFVALFSILAVESAVAQGGPPFQDTVVVTAAADEEPLREVNAAMTVIGRQEIEDTGAASVSELLRQVPGAFVLRSGLDNGVTTLFVRGTNASHTLVLVGGVRVNSPYFGGYDWSIPLTSGIDRVEIVRGPYSALYGGDAIGGVVQILPPATRADGLRMFVEGGGSRWRRAEIETSYSTGRVDIAATAAQRDGSGELDNDDFSTRTASVDLGLQLSPGAKARLVLRQTAARTGIPFSGPDLTPRRSTETDESIVALPLDIDLGNGSRIEATASWVARSLVFRDPDEPFGLTHSDTQADSVGARVAWHGQVGRHRLAVGGEWRRDEVTDTSSFGPTLTGERIGTAAAFFQDRVALGRHWHLQAGVRVDRAEPWGSEVSPRVTLARESGGGRVWASFGNGFRAPSLGELYYPYSGNQQLVAERSRCTELGALLNVGTAGRLQVAAFRNRVDDLIEFDYAASTFENVANAAQDGVEASWTAPAYALGTLTAGLTLLDARDGEGRPLLRRPRWSASAAVQRSFAGGVEARLTVAWVGERSDVDPLTYARVDAPGFLTASLAAGVPLSGRFELRARVENLADRAYEEVTGYPAPRRRLFLGLEAVLD